MQPAFLTSIWQEYMHSFTYQFTIVFAWNHIGRNDLSYTQYLFGLPGSSLSVGDQWFALALEWCQLLCCRSCSSFGLRLALNLCLGWVSIWIGLWLHTLLTVRWLEHLSILIFSGRKVSVRRVHQLYIQTPFYNWDPYGWLSAQPADWWLIRASWGAGRHFHILMELVHLQYYLPFWMCSWSNSSFLSRSFMMSILSCHHYSGLPVSTRWFYCWA